MLVLTGDLDSRVFARDATLTDRLAARLRGARLDRELARGASPEASVGLAVRAQILVRPRTRRYLARSLGRLLSAASLTGPAGRTGLAAASVMPMVRRERLRQTAAPMEALIDHLLAAAPVSGRGVAQVSVLLSDGTGPLYGSGSCDDLRRSLQQALDALEPLNEW